MSDFAEQLFGDVQEEYYPGSKRKLGAKPEPKTNPVLASEWDAKPKVLKVKGVEVEFFTIGQLADAINRRPVTIRSWETKGVIPKARFKTKEGRRLYTRRQVEGLIQLCHKHGILDFQARPDAIPAAFKADVLALWREDIE